MENDDELIAIVSMDCRLPQAGGVEEFWQKLVDGESAIRDLTDAEVAAAGVPADRRGRTDYVKRAGVLDGVAEFDSAYFGYSPREADVLDVQQRLMLESSVTLLERANIDPHRTEKRIGVFAGSGMSTYLFGALSRPELVDSLGEMVVRHGNDKDFLATRISYKLNLHGPSVNVQTACSTGLVAVHSGVQSLLLNECDAAIAGAVYVRVPQESGYQYQVGGVLSPDGVCRPFDAGANGTLFTNGLGLVLLKRLRDAIADGDRVHAVIAGSAVNNDGAQKVSFTAPSVSGQVGVLSEALQISGAKQTDVTYIESHGTGTQLGDPIEIEAIKQAYGYDGAPCGIGSLKGNFGHLNIAAGIIGLIKAALVLQHRYVPPTINVGEVSPALDLDGSRYFVTTEGRALDGDGEQWAAVSAFGMGGTNSHVLLKSFEQALAEPAEPGESAEPGASGESGEPDESGASADGPAVLTFSARTEDALRGQALALAEHLAAHPDASLAQYAYTLREGRTRHPFRASLAAVDRAEAITRLKAERYHRGSGAGEQEIAFVFAGQGTQRRAMGAVLAAKNRQFARRLDEAVEAVNAHLDFDVRTCLGPDGQVDGIDTSIAQPLLFVVEYALATALVDAGVRPRYVLGHSLGEIVAATVAGVFDLPVAAELVATRARLMGDCPGGAMLAVTDTGPLADLLDDGSLSVAATNSPRQTVLSGSHEAIEAAAARAADAGVQHQRLATSHAFHSPLMREAADAFRAFLGTVELRAPRIPLVSNVTGRPLTEYEARSPHYWADHLLRPVRFTESVEALREAEVTRFVEIGPGRAMSNLVKAAFGTEAAGLELAQALGDSEHEDEAFADAVALGWAADPEVPLAPYASAERMTSVPTYAFDRQVHWVEPVLGFAAQDAPTRVPAQTPAQTPTQAPTDTPADAPTDAPAEAASADGSDEATAEIRRIVGGVFEGFLGAAAADTDSEFFALGGNSLMAIQLINKLRETFELDFSVRDFYENSSVSATTNVIKALLLEEPAHV
ncbi:MULTISPECIES: beta-ketoacyl synthase N-terminal-like domain-containing protein [unclassified Streptomyces]|uniref:beta-ketoacyl synthase N-terminal-like domain-containing protein n=1 Tax=unclassified Streptomyces TaxID=2593676 RepID=UPI00278C37EC|nr:MULTISPECIES: beta-ketoacyl synthase N-terminal-like domain-containing protein [unclassified Streptomyces]